jgi:hypothetical protein
VAQTLKRRDSKIKSNLFITIKAFNFGKLQRPQKANRLAIAGKQERS